MHRAQERLVEGAGNLACAVRLLGLLMRCRFQLGRKDHALLVAHLHPEVVDTDEQVHSFSSICKQHHMRYDLTCVVLVVNFVVLCLTNSKDVSVCSVTLTWAP